MSRNNRFSHSSDLLQFFDQLPDSAYVRQPVVQALFGISHATVWRWCNSGHLPKPIKPGPRVTAWNVGALRATQTALREPSPSAEKSAP
ncbi:helix-turn-helix transcriptional regulator [Stenotrophobium rhamnosiphilum]|uniref:Transcriptional regulator n=1 Tax=Stenotrophobium rhamnosiphilum TaxID=2029166 RepID=A0A2T5MIK8_9GAMM|nr:transcriptional regulator [Stenotrophobium rhamnosiphilum]